MQPLVLVKCSKCRWLYVHLPRRFDAGYRRKKLFRLALIMATARRRVCVRQ